MNEGMKTVLILFLCTFALSAEAQDSTKWQVDLGYSRNFQLLMSDIPRTLTIAGREYSKIFLDTVEIYPFDERFLIVLDSAWREYKAECAESIKVANSWNEIDTARMRREPPEGNWFWVKVDSVLRPRNPYPSAEEFFDVWLPKKLKGRTP